MPKKPYHQIAIVDCQEPLVPIPPDLFAVESPHPYQKLGAPYGDKSPFFLRRGVVNSLITAQNYLQQYYPGWHLKIFDAYRPIEVQQFMVDYTFSEVVRTEGLNSERLTARQRQIILEKVYRFWAVPSSDPKSPPPHSTGSAVDLTLADETDQTVDMGSEIDEISERSHPDFFANSTDPVKQQYNERRQLLLMVMTKAGFERHPYEWWHFSLGDQMWVWLQNQQNHDARAVARYGTVNPRIKTDKFND